MSPIAARLERLPFSRFHFKLLIMGGLGFMFEAIDAAIIAFILPVVRTKWHLTSFETGTSACRRAARRSKKLRLKSTATVAPVRPPPI